MDLIKFGACMVIMAASGAVILPCGARAEDKFPFDLVSGGHCGVTSGRYDLAALRMFVHDITETMTSGHFNGQSLMTPDSVVEYFAAKYDQDVEAAEFLDLVWRAARAVNARENPVERIYLPTFGAVGAYAWWQSVFDRLGRRTRDQQACLVALLQLEMHATQGIMFDALFPEDLAEVRDQFMDLLIQVRLVRPDQPEVELVRRLKDKQVIELSIEGEPFAEGRSDFARELSSLQVDAFLPTAVFDLGPLLEVIDYYAAITRSQPALAEAIVARAAKFYQDSSPRRAGRGVTKIDLPDPRVDPDGYWRDAFQEAGKHGVPMIIALLKSLPVADQTPDAVKTLILKVIAEFR